MPAIPNLVIGSLYNPVVSLTHLASQPSNASHSSFQKLGY